MREVRGADVSNGDVVLFGANPVDWRTVVGDEQVYAARRMLTVTGPEPRRRTEGFTLAVLPDDILIVADPTGQ